MGFLDRLQSWLDKPMIPGGVGAACVEAIKGIGELTGSICAGVGNFAQGGAAVVAAAANMVSFGGSDMGSRGDAQAVQEPKLGANARKEEMLAAMPVDRSEYAANFNTVQVPVTQIAPKVQTNDIQMA
jgi:hypothetical protein